MHMIKRLNDSLQQKGVLETLKSALRILADYSFDLKYGTDTTRRVDVGSLETDSENKAHATLYQASKTRPLLKLFRQIQMPKGGVFVDIGCGKGRVLLIAAKLGFKRVVGIEFCARLCFHARKNAKLFLRKTAAGPSIEVVEADITCHEFKGDENIFFLYNPFDSIVLGQVLDSVRKSVSIAPRDIWLIYNNPVHHEIVLQSSIFGQCSRFEIEGEVFHVYRHEERTGV